MEGLNEINEIKLPEGVDRIAVKQHDDKIVIKLIPKGDGFKNGDFVYEDGRIMIVKNYPNSCHALIYPKLDMEPIYNRRYAPNRPLSSLSFRYATEEEKQLLIDALKKDGKRWNAEKLEIEDISQYKFKAGDAVKIKHGISSKTHREACPCFVGEMDKFIGKELTVKGYSDGGFVFFNEYEDDHEYYFSEDWLEPWSEEPKKGDWAIFWDNRYLMPLMPLIRLYYCKTDSGNRHIDDFGTPWDNAVKWDGTKEQFEKVSRGEI